MLEIKVHYPIAAESGVCEFTAQGESGVFSLDTVQAIFEAHTEEKDVLLNIHCNGGEVPEGLAIYDYLRSSGRNIYTNIEGSCHSMATILLLAAPRENRSANPNARAIIHKVKGGVGGSVEEVRNYAEFMAEMQDSIADIYVDRTFLDKEQAMVIINEEKPRTAEELLAWGFINKINGYNTNYSITQKTKKMEILKKIQDFVGSLVNEVENEAIEPTNYIYYDENGNELFRTEREDDFIEVGMKAEPDGDFDIGERIVIIRDGIITEIREKEPRNEEMEALRAELDAERANVAALREQLEQATNLLNEAKAHIVSQGKIGNRLGNAATSNKGNKEPMNAEERKSLMAERIKKAQIK